MLIEITGGLGSGKSVLTGLLARQLETRSVPAIVQRAQRWNEADPSTAVHALQFARRHDRLTRLTVEAVLRDADSMRARLALTWALTRKAGTFARLHRSAERVPVIWDEGVMHMAHNAFVHVAKVPRESEIREFGELVPRPDVIVRVRAPVDTAVARVLSRGHRRAADRTDRARRLVVNADRVFSRLVEVDRIRERLIEVDNDGDEPEILKPAVDVIVALVEQEAEAERR